MKTFIATLGIAVLLAANGLAQDIAITPTKRIDLFNGKDFTGWEFTSRGDAPAAETWSVTNGVIHCTGQPYCYARTETPYRDYKLTVEWRFVKIVPKADNSGIFVQITGPDKVWPACIEVQGQHGKQGDLRMNGGATADKHDTAETKNADALALSNEKPPGEWNTFEVECRGDSITLVTNGKWMNRISRCRPSSGAIGIQSEGGEIEVRKIYIEPLFESDIYRSVTN
jgi:hypothetical protein